MTKYMDPPPFSMTNMQKNMNPPPSHMTQYAKYEPPPTYICKKTKNITFYEKYEISNRGYPQRVPPVWHFFRDTRYGQYVKYVQYVHLGCAWPVGAQPLQWTCWPAAQPWYWFCSHCATKHKLCSGVPDCVCADHMRRMWETSSDILCILFQFPVYPGAISVLNIPIFHCMTPHAFQEAARCISQ